MDLNSNNWSYVGSTNVGGAPRKDGTRAEWWYYVSKNGQVVRHRSDSQDNIINVNLAYTANQRIDNKPTTGYLAVPSNQLCEKYVHRMVAKAFCHNPDPETHTQVNHIDGDKSNNHYTNLEWVTQSQNMKHMHAMRRAAGKQWYGRAGDPKEQS